MEGVTTAATPGRDAAAGAGAAEAAEDNSTGGKNNRSSSSSSTSALAPTWSSDVADWHNNSHDLKQRIQELWESREAAASEQRQRQQQHSGEGGGGGAAGGDGAGAATAAGGGPLNWAFEHIPISLFPPFPSGRVIEVASDASVADAIHTLATHGILSAPVRNVAAAEDASWIERYMGMVDFPGIVLWVLHHVDPGLLQLQQHETGAAGVAGAEGKSGAPNPSHTGADNTSSSSEAAAAATDRRGPRSNGVAEVEQRTSRLSLETSAAPSSSPSSSSPPAPSSLPVIRAAPPVDSSGSSSSSMQQRQRDSLGFSAADLLGSPGLRAVASVSSDFFSMLHNSHELQNTKVEDIAGSFRWAPFIPLSPDDSLLTLLLLISAYRVRTIPVVEPGQGPIRNVITQTSVVHLLAGCEGLPWFDTLAGKSLEELGLPVVKGDDVVMVEDTAPVLEPFQRMLAHGIGGVPVVAQGTRNVVGSVSVRDIQLLLLHPHLLHNRRRLTVSDFLAAAKGASAAECLTSPAREPPIRIRSSLSLAQLVRRLRSSRMQRAYVTDAFGSLEGVVTLRDIIGRFVSEPKGYFGDFFQSVVPDVHPQATAPVWV